MNNESSFDLFQFNLLDKIGEGAFGEVYKIKEKKTGQIYVAKFFFNTVPKEGSSKTSIANFISDAKILTKLNYPSISSFIGYSPVDFKKEYNPVVVTKFIGNISLNEYIQLGRKGDSIYQLSETKKLISIYGIASAMQLLHSLQIIHGNLKPSNILFDKQLNPIISDYGLTKITHPKQEKDLIIYQSPEILSDSTYTKESDVYAFAMIIYELFSKEKPFNKYSAKEITDKIRNGDRPEFNFDIPQSYQKLIEKCWSKYPSKRPTFEEITQELQTNPDFITDFINETEYHNYINIISQARLESTYNCGRHLYNDESTPSNKEKAAQMFKIGAKSFHLNSMVAYAVMLDNGDGIRACPGEASAIFKEAADRGDAGAMLVYSIKLAKGDGVGVDLGGSAKYCRMAADAGLNEAIFEYSKILSNGYGVPSDPVKSAEYSLIGAEKGDARCMLSYGSKLYHGNGVEKDKEKAAMYVRKAAVSGDPDAMYFYAAMLQKGEGVESDEEESTEYLRRAAEAGQTDAMCDYGSILLRQGENGSAAANFLKGAADKGSARAMYLYACMLDSGKGVPQDHPAAARYCKMAADRGDVASMASYALMCRRADSPREAARYLRMAADNGDADSAFNFACALAKGDGVALDKCAASKYFKTAADSGNPGAMNNYAWMLRVGDGVPVDLAASAQYFKRAADLGEVSAMNNYACMLKEGHGVPVDKPEAARYYRLAIAKGDSDAMQNYAAMLQVGDGVAKDESEAARYYKMASDTGDARALFAKALRLLGTHDRKNEPECLECLRAAADKGLVEASALYGSTLLARDKGTAARYLKTAADGCDVPSMRSYAAMNDAGDGVPVDKHAAARYYRMAADAGDKDAMYAFAQMVGAGEGVDQNKPEKVRYMKMAADHGKVEAMVKYALMVERGIDTETDREEAVRYFRMAADLGSVPAMCELAEMLVRGDGVKASRRQAVHYLRMAAKKGDKAAIGRLKELAAASGK